VGDLVLATTLIDKARAAYEVHLLAKPAARDFLFPTYPDVIFHSFVAPWTVFYGKYRVWRWRWPELARLIHGLRRESFDAAVSVRQDPRDHFLMWLMGVRQRYGFPTRGSELFLTRPVWRRDDKQHRVEDWRQLGDALNIEAEKAEPRLAGEKYRSNRIEETFASVSIPLICLHAGARIAVRRWPAEYFEEIIYELRKEFRFHLLLIPDLDGFGASLEKVSDSVLSDLSLHELVAVLSRVDLLLCNDSGPMHIAAACGRPVISIFGPSHPDWFHPWGDTHKIIIRDICPYRPCFDYCRFPEPYCLTKLTPAEAWPEINQHVLRVLSHKSLASVDKPT
jgi:heptosyltransferase-2